MNVANTNDVGGEFEDNLEKCDNNLLQKAEFAALCSFIHHFGTELGIYLTFPQLEQFLNLSKSANWKNWETLHIKLLNKLKYRARPERWEPVLGRFLVNHAANVDGRLAEAAECLVSGVCAKSSTLSFQTSPVHISRPYSPVYYGLGADIRTRLLLTLLESQFDRNQGFKDKVNLRSAVDLRFRPLGYDVWGRIYWLLKDSEINLLLYREDSVKETFQLICRTTEDMRAVRTQLENACPASTKLSEILTHRGEPALTDETVTPASPSLTSQLHHLVQAGIASTEDEQTITASTEVPLTNGVASPVPTPTPSPTCLVQNGLSELVKLADISSLPVVKPEPELSGDVKDSIISAEISEHMNGVPSADGEYVKSKLEADPPNSPVLSGSVKSDRDNGVNPSQSPLKTELKPEDSIEPNEQPEVTTVTARAKGRRRERIAKAARDQIPSDTVISSTPTLEVRRSGRVRKPVEFLTMEAPQPKRSRQSTKLQTDLTASDAQHHHHTQVDDSDEQPKKKRRSKKSKENQLRKTKKKKQKRRHAKKSRGSNPWLNATSSSESDSEDDTFDRALMEHDQLDEEDSDTVDTNQQKSDALDWLDQPESDFNPDELDRDSDVDSLTQGRNFARQKRLERMRADRAAVAAAAALASNISADETCQVCGKAHEPEWILLCDRCDRGHHAMCLSPPLFVIPEGDWFCPRCQHATLLQALAECADQIDAEQKKQTIWKRMQERLNFVNISMTNILADGDDEGRDGEGKRRARLNANVVYRDSDLSQEDSENSDEDRLRSHSEESDGFYKTDESGSGSVRFGRRRTISRRRASQHARLVNGSTRHSVRRSTLRRRRNRWLSGSEDEDDASASSGASFTPPAPRAARQRPIQYDLGEAFKKLEEALEDDEKYQEEKRRRRSRKLNHEDQSDSPRDVVVSASPPSGPPPGRSRGKDLSNIMGPNWEEQLDLDRPSRSRKRRVGVLSSSSTDSDADEAPVPDGRQKRRKANSDDDDDVDFQPSGASEDLSERSDEDGEDEVEPTSESESDSSWLCAVRRRRRGVGKRALRGPNRKRSKFSSRRRGRPIPRFEESEDEELLDQEDSLRDGSSRSRLRRCARAVVNYRESDNQDDDDDENENGCVKAESVRARPSNRCRLASSTDEDSEQGTKANDAEASTSGRPQPPVSKLTKGTKDGVPTRNRRVLSSSESEYEPDQSEEEEADEEPDQSGKLAGLNEKYSTANTDQSVEIKKASSPGYHSVEKSLVFAQEDTAPSLTRSESGSPTELRITESSPEPISPSVIPVERSAVRVTHVEDETSRDEESVEEDAEDLLPRHAFPARPPAAEDKSPVQTGNLSVSPDLFG